MIFLKSLIIFALIIFILGTISGIFILKYFKDNVVYKFLYSFWGGALLSYMCFGFISDIFYKGGIIYSLIFIFSGIGFSLIYEKYEYKIILNCILCFLMGIVLSSIYFVDNDIFICSSFLTSIYFLCAIKNKNIYNNILYSAIIVASGILGVYFEFDYNKNAEFIFSVAGGTILYVICREVLPEKILCFSDVFISILAVFGFLYGIKLFAIII